MRKFKVNVNGNLYEVEVEELGGTATYQTAPAPQPRAAAPAPAPAPVAAPAPAPAAKAPVAGGAGLISSPMPGVIKDVRVKVGDVVGPDTIVVILEAMKMENEIFAGMSGKVTAVHTSRDASVNTDEPLVTIG
ncbi:MAG TPA: acetyl-CoA carboxylase biotin carboxyl carrier protein subunit [Bacillota bacterium]|nr:MAG: Glutaconyl-CoA decarboxylase subunit gamma [Firmicutes bacterium ADurb.Bin153]HNV34297.1 acetyl-CoA carboxylase biotin carboxyl carrier protein subunit [Bacillota bacterium]